MSPAITNRCPWACQTAIERDYHDNEWGVPLHDDRRWFEAIVLDGAQAGLSWLTILKKRPAYRQAFAGFDPHKVACFDDNRVTELLANPGIVRNRLKIRSAINNARAFIRIQEQSGSFDEWIWRYVDGEPIINRYRTPDQVPTETGLSRQISRDLKKSGFSFVGPTIVYALMQATGLVNDHLLSCFCHPDNLS